MYSNIAKSIFEMIAPKYSKQYKYLGNESEYPFELSNHAFDALAKSVAYSRQLIPASAFKGSWIKLDVNSSKSLFRSSEWHDWLLYSFPTLVCAQYDNPIIRKGFLCLVRGISLSLQFQITQENLKEIEK